MTRMLIAAEGVGVAFVAVDCCACVRVELYAVRSDNRFEVLDPIRQRAGNISERLQGARQRS